MHSHYKYKKMSWEKNDEEEKMPDLRLGNVFHLPSRRIFRRWNRSGTNLVIFLEALCAQTNLFWREMKINNVYYWNLIHDKKILAPKRDILDAHFHKYANRVVYQLDFLKMNLLHKSKMKCFKSPSCLRTCSKFIIQAPSKWKYTNETEYFGTV